jgi:hypothetical protein
VWIGGCFSYLKDEDLKFHHSGVFFASKENAKTHSPTNTFAQKTAVLGSNTAHFLCELIEFDTI